MLQHQPVLGVHAVMMLLTWYLQRSCMYGKKDPALAPKQVISVIDLLTVKLHCNVLSVLLMPNVATSASTRCPCCDDAAHLVPRSMQPASDIIQRLLCDVIILCETCTRDVQVGDYDSHECQRSGVLEELMA